MMLLRSQRRRLLRDHQPLSSPTQSQLVKRLSQQSTTPNECQDESQSQSKRRKKSLTSEKQASDNQVNRFDAFRLENQSATPFDAQNPSAQQAQEANNSTKSQKSNNKKRKKQEPTAAESTSGPKQRSPPAKWKQVVQGIEQMRAQQVASVDVDGVEVFYDDKSFDLHVTRFHVLVSAMLSSQTKDPVTAAAMRRLTSRGLTVQTMLEIDENELVELIRPVSFLNCKAKHIKQVAEILNNQAKQRGDTSVDIPKTYEELIALPGVGPKMAHLVMSCAWKNTVGICVDTHVHRICNRLGWVNTWNKKNTKAQDPEKTREELEQWLPREHWATINPLLVGFGQTICAPRGPKCGECSVRDLCPSAFKSSI